MIIKSISIALTVALTGMAAVEASTFEFSYEFDNAGFVTGSLTAICKLMGTPS